MWLAVVALPTSEGYVIDCCCVQSTAGPRALEAVRHSERLTVTAHALRAVWAANNGRQRGVRARLSVPVRHRLRAIVCHRRVCLPLTTTHHLRNMRGNTTLMYFCSAVVSLLKMVIEYCSLIEYLHKSAPDILTKLTEILKVMFPSFEIPVCLRLLRVYWPLIYKR